MSELRGRLFTDGKLITGTLRWEGERITAVELEGEIGGSELPIIAPGLVDLHVHGFAGCDPLDDLAGMTRALAREGTTAFQPTLFPAQPQVLGEQARATWARARALEGERSSVSAARTRASREQRSSFERSSTERTSPASPAERASSLLERKPLDLASIEHAALGARIVGLHLEGPFVNPKAAGALPIGDLATPSLAALAAILGSSTGDAHGIRTMTIAPELAGSADLVRELARAGVRVSLGHSLASAKDARRAAVDGAAGVTHLFNAMSPFHHRDAGLASFALTDAALFCELIGDLVHVGPEAIELALRARGVEGLCLVSDALSGAGTGCATFHSHGREHLVEDGAAFYPPRAPNEAPRLAGSASSQLEMVRKLTSRGVLGLPEALAMASTTPARALGLDRELGDLRPGFLADWITLRGSALELDGVWIAGRRVAR